MLMNLFKFKGGVKPPTNKTQSVTLPIAIAPLPSHLVVPPPQRVSTRERAPLRVVMFVYKDATNDSRVLREARTLLSLIHISEPTRPY